MKDYFAFGGCLRSALDFPDLSPCPSTALPDWEVQLSASQPTRDGELQGERVVQPGWILRLFRLPEGWRLEYGATGSYEVFDNGRRIVWHQGEDRREEVARAVILGPIMALALHESGTLCLHGSAVAIGQKGIGFLAPKGYGKSALAVTLAAAGVQLMSDDLLAVTTSIHPEVLPGVHSVRMHGDVTEMIAGKFPGALLRDGWKNTLMNMPRDRLAWSRVALDSLYLIAPIVDPRSEDTVRRSRLKPMEAAVALAAHAKISDLFSPVEAGKLLQWIAQIVSRIPIYHIEVPRDLERLPSVAEQIIAWHST